uniref:Uncharacterized protein n=1 Tax=Aegilops tauschii subsp. strangulata TaxID=200361 RepID=A0A453HZX7_AEGTS
MICGVWLLIVYYKYHNSIYILMHVCILRCFFIMQGCMLWCAFSLCMLNDEVAYLHVERNSLVGASYLDIEDLLLASCLLLIILCHPCCCH